MIAPRGHLSRVVEANDDCYGASVSSNGRVTFYSAANNLVSNDPNYRKDIFVHDRETDQTVRVNLASDGTEANASSCCPSTGQRPLTSSIGSIWMASKGSE